MEARNTLQPAAPAQNTGMTTYDSNGVQVSLNFDIVRKYLVSGGGDVTNQDIAMFIGMCRAQGLNPFNRDAYLVKYGSSGPATMITGKDVFLKRAQADPSYEGLQAGIIVRNIQSGEITEREGTFYMDGEEIVGGWAKVYQRGRRFPTYESVNMKEYIGLKKSGEINEQWTKRPATMIRKVAVVHALREAFPAQLGALYAQEEFEGASGMVLDETPIQMTEQPQIPVQKPAPAVYGEQQVFYTADAVPPVADPAAALFD